MIDRGPDRTRRCPGSLIALATLAMAVAACTAEDGGRSGTGVARDLVVETVSVTTTLEGNVLAIDGETSLPSDLVVEVVGATAGSGLLRDGTFLLSGEFGGPVALRFSSASEAWSATLDTVLPRGSTAQASDVRIERRSGSAFAAAMALVFEGRITSRDCLKREVVLVSPPGSRDLVPVRLPSILFGHDGSECRAYDLGNLVEVTAVVTRDQEFAATEINEPSAPRTDGATTPEP